MLNAKFADLNNAHHQLTKQANIFESSLSTATRQIESLNQESSSLRQENERLNVVNRKITKEAQELESNYLWTKDTLAKIEAREREAVDNFKNAENNHRILLEQKNATLSSLDVFKQQNQRMEENLRSSSEEIAKVFFQGLPCREMILFGDCSPM